MNEQNNDLRQTPFFALHKGLGARLVPFAGYLMPLQFEGIMAEHLWTRAHAGLFDVSHMGQVIIQGPDWDALAGALEKLMPCDVLGLKPGRQRYSQLLNDQGGILDDLIVARLPRDENDLETAFLVVNGACKHADFAHLKAHLPSSLSLTMDERKALLALQGPKARAVLTKLIPECQKMGFMTLQTFAYKGHDVLVSCSGYTGEDGFELSCDAQAGVMLAEELLQSEDVKPIGLGARDSLRLEASMCLYGHDMNEEVSPIEAGLLWSIPKRRRQNGGFKGASIVQQQIKNGAELSRVGLMIDSRQPAREGALVQRQGKTIGKVTSGGFSPTLKKPIAMALIHCDNSALDQPLQILIRDKVIDAQIVPMPFVPHRMNRL
jgi:aminomethyltransferase